MGAGLDFGGLLAEPALRVAQGLIALRLIDLLEPLEALHGGVQSAQLCAMLVEVIEGREQRRIEQLDQRVELEWMQLHRCGRQQEHRLRACEIRIGDLVDQAVEVRRRALVAPLVGSPGMMGLVDNHHVPTGARDVVAPSGVPSGIARGRDHEIPDGPRVFARMLVGDERQRVSVVEREGQVEFGLEFLLPLADQA